MTEVKRVLGTPVEVIWDRTLVREPAREETSEVAVATMAEAPEATAAVADKGMSLVRASMLMVVLKAALSVAAIGISDGIILCTADNWLESAVSTLPIAEVMVEVSGMSLV